MNRDFHQKFSLYTRESEKLEAAYHRLQKKFYTLKHKYEDSHQKLELIITHMSEGLIFVSETGIIELLNLAAADFMECSAEKATGQTFWELFSDRFFGFSMREALACPSARKRVFISLSDGKEIDVSTSWIPQKGILLLLSNRKEKQCLEKSLDQTERLQELGEMAACLAHEIRNPLGGIEGFAQLLKRDLEEPAHQRMVKAILEGAQTLNDLVTQVLDYARPMQLHFAAADLVSLVNETLSLPSISEHPPLYRFSSIHPIYVLSIDAMHIKLVLLNLLRNAQEAGATCIDLELKEEGFLVIKDNGAGIRQSNLKKIFTPFFTTKENGTGLGLAQALAVIKAHGGTMEVSSEEGKGTQFIISFGLNRL